MDAIEILALTVLDKPIYILHKRKFTEYRLNGTLLVKINDVWVKHIKYWDINTRENYARTPDNFGSFKLERS